MNHVRSDLSPANHRAHQPAPHQGHSGHWMMVACCIPMLVIAIALVGTGVASPSFIFAAVACTAMMTLMHGGMGHSGHDSSKADEPASPGVTQGGSYQVHAQSRESRDTQQPLHEG